ncbi:hypothetical protein C8J24_2575 [Sphingomonas aerolata]|uniref:Uncharacterized protein n=1 Tax=Sphingomonas aerolata TaxID=185951 RepID=A0A2T4YLT0_9SPHN|nr:hypothetical protein C8J24_2575 [Sphingomonas aerolata]
MDDGPFWANIARLVGGRHTWAFRGVVRHPVPCLDDRRKDPCIWVGNAPGLQICKSQRRHDGGSVRFEVSKSRNHCAQRLGDKKIPGHRSSDFDNQRCRPPRDQKPFQLLPKCRLKRRHRRGCPNAFLDDRQKRYRRLQIETEHWSLPQISGSTSASLSQRNAVDGSFRRLKLGSSHQQSISFESAAPVPPHTAGELPDWSGNPKRTRKARSGKPGCPEPQYFKGTMSTWLESISRFLRRQCPI